MSVLSQSLLHDLGDMMEKRRDDSRDNFFRVSFVMHRALDDADYS